ncbi:protein POLAR LOCALIZATION DURING ASYMMETRIC DIVISION AND REDISTRIBUTION isoform X2 [Helianthus annuus]|uniref:protein POLAR LOCALIZATION DURING ASYMMETRIC DIVISION AND REDISTRIBUTION isoform X2 n=1 Tax=Helianthus annuus TaxID=4232 RepID=UPI001652D7DA|nr:protein POLAR LOCALIZATION DURING ASYMMETRIC DIVISION AND REDISTRIBUTION isoform X2 [Helianthus annuus]
MWQLLLAAAVAASGYVARNILYKDHNKPTNLFSHNHDLLTDSPKNASEEMSPVFRFCSASNGSKNVRKKVGRSGGIKGYRLNNERRVVNVDDDGKKKFGVCLKKRRVGRNGFAKCQSFDVKDKSSFGYGVGVGIMYMMSAGKAEIERLNAAVDETAKVVQELKAEISKRKSSYDSKVENTANIKQSVSEKSSEANNNIEVYGLSINDEGENASSVITEEPHRDVVEMEQLEAELESELLKLQVSTTSSSFQGNGVMPYELDQKLCHLLIEQQESQIVDLESELQHTNSKLVEKESELQALKDCVKRLSDLSVTCPSDEETEGALDEARNKMIYGNGRSMAGIKRAIDFD